MPGIEYSFASPYPHQHQHQWIIQVGGGEGGGVYPAATASGWIEWHLRVSTNASGKY